MALTAGGRERAGNRILTVGVERKPELAGVGGNGARRRPETPVGAEARLMVPEFRTISVSVHFGARVKLRDAVPIRRQRKRVV